MKGEILFRTQTGKTGRGTSIRRASYGKIHQQIKLKRADTLQSGKTQEWKVAEEY